MDALAKAREIAARLSGNITGSNLGKRSRWDEDQSGGAGLGSIQRKKVYVPVKEHPDINFLGLLIGPKGATQKQMQEMSGAKIIIRGRGAQKDGSSGGNPDDDDDLHVCIEGSEEAVQKAMKEVEQILFNPEQAMRLKSVQLQHLAESRSGGGGGGDIYGPGGGAGNGSDYQIELRVPNNMVGLIIGKGGENILRIQSQLGVHAQIAKESEMQPGETLRSIVLKGSPSGVSEAKVRIDDIITAQLMKQSGMGGDRGGNSHREMDCAFVVKLPVPNDKVGIIIGKGGMTIKGIQERTRANVQIPPQPDEDDPNVRTLSIGGDSKEAVDAAQMEIFMTLQAQQQQAQNAYNSSSNAMLLMVPDDKVGIIIGKGGATVKDIQNRLKVRVQIPQQPDLGSNPPVRTISIAGAADAQAAARYEIEMIVAGTPLHPGQGGDRQSSSTQQYGGQQYGTGPIDPWNTSSMYGGSYYGAQAQPYGNMQQAYMQQQPYAAAMASYYGAAAVANPYAQTAETTATPAAAEVPTDPTAYYNDYWQYAMYYGEAAARLYYGAWSPPEGTPPPAGITVAAAAPAATDANPPPPSDSAPLPAADTMNAAAAALPAGDSNQATTSVTPAAEVEMDPEAAAAAWEAYKAQYAEWYEAYGKAAGADPNPPAM